MEQNRFDQLAHALSGRPSRRTLAGMLSLGAAWLAEGFRGEVASARKKHKKKARKNAFGCVDVGKFCKNGGQCCSGQSAKRTARAPVWLVRGSLSAVARTLPARRRAVSKVSAIPRPVTPATAPLMATALRAEKTPTVLPSAALTPPASHAPVAPRRVDSPAWARRKIPASLRRCSRGRTNGRAVSQPPAHVMPRGGGIPAWCITCRYPRRVATVGAR